LRAPWFIDLPSVNLDNEDLVGARQRMGQHMDASVRGRHPDRTGPGFEGASSVAVQERKYPYTPVEIATQTA
jgi:hypothetical protein